MSDFLAAHCIVWCWSPPHVHHPLKLLLLRLNFSNCILCDELIKRINRCFRSRCSHSSFGAVSENWLLLAAPENELRKQMTEFWVRISLKSRHISHDDNGEVNLLFTHSLRKKVFRSIFGMFSCWLRYFATRRQPSKSHHRLKECSDFRFKRTWHFCPFIRASVI